MFFFASDYFSLLQAEQANKHTKIEKVIITENVRIQNYVIVV